MSIIPSPRKSPHSGTPCVPGCIVDHTPGTPDDGTDGALYCRTAAGTVPCGTAWATVALAEVATDRCVVTEPEDFDCATPWRVVVTVPSSTVSCTPEGARALAWELLGRADLIERLS